MLLNVPDHENFDPIYHQTHPLMDHHHPFDLMNLFHLVFQLVTDYSINLELLKGNLINTIHVKSN